MLNLYKSFSLGGHNHQPKVSGTSLMSSKVHRKADEHIKRLCHSLIFEFLQNQHFHMFPFTDQCDCI
jgi:hypothetical protein